MTTLGLTAFVFFYGFSVGAVLTEVENEAIEYERSRMEVFREDVDTRLGRCFYFPVWIYVATVDHFERRERAS